MPGTQQTIDIGVSPDAFFDVITDYERYPQILDEMEDATVLSRTGNTAEVRFSVHLFKRVTYALTLVENKPKSVAWSLKEGPFKVSNGRWDLQPTSSGHTRATYMVEVEVAAFVPKSVSNRIVGKTVPKLLASFKGHAERLHTDKSA